MLIARFDGSFINYVSYAVIGTCGSANVFSMPFLAANGYAELGKRTFESERQDCVLLLVQNQKILVLCSGFIFGLIGGWPCDLLLRVAECVGIAAAMYTPLPAFAAEQVASSVRGHG